MSDAIERDCPVCGGDCADANPPVMNCPLLDAPEPCTSEARFCGCTCRMETVWSNSIDPPEPIIDGWCPLHGNRDADWELQQQRDEGAQS